jgi:hypothetical protein
MLYQIFLECAGFYDGGTGFAETLQAQRKNGLTKSLNSSGGGTDKAFYDKVF